MNIKVIEAIKKSAAVPSVPQVVTRFLEIMQDPDFDYNDLVKVLSADAGTVSEILRLVNSALFGVRHKIVSLRQALTLLGPMRTRSLLVGRYLVDTMAQKDVKGLDMGYFWRRSLASSVVSSRLAESTLPHQREEVFIGALLADIGIPILSEAMPDKYKSITVRYAPQGVPFTAEEELDAVEATHAQVSAMVLSHWSLPDTVATAVNLHQSDNPGQGDAATIARILRASDVIARHLCESPRMYRSGCVHGGEHRGPRRPAAGRGIRYRVIGRCPENRRDSRQRLCPDLQGHPGAFERAHRRRLGSRTSSPLSISPGHLRSTPVSPTPNRRPPYRQGTCFHCGN